jgi:hypothetical protein
VVSMSSPTRVTLLVGAGLVADAGLPKSVDLALKLKEALAEASANTRLDESQRALAELQLAAFHFLNGGIRFQEGILNRDPDNPVNIEQIAVAALELQARLENPLAPYTSGWHQRIVELEKQRPDLLERFVDFMYSQLATWLQFESLDKISYLARLADFCSDGFGVDIFSLNYDLCIETALSRIAKKAFVNGFTEEGWRPPALWEIDTPIRLFKLHGSLDWAEDEAYGVCSFQFPRHKDAEDIEGKTRPLLIFGTNHKLSAREPFLSLAYHFSQRVLSTTTFAIVGYSFGDNYINEIIKQGLRTNSRLKIIIVSPKPAEQIVRFPLLDHPRIKIIRKGTEEALNKSLLLNEVREVLKDALNEEPFGTSDTDIT